MRVLFTNHYSCHNRGCEAIVRTTGRTVADGIDCDAIALPSRSPAHDQAVLADSGLPFAHSERRPGLAERALRRLQTRGVLGSDRRLWPLPVPRAWQHAIAQSDLVISVGGDNYTLDYGIPTATAGIDDCAARHGRPVVLWGASVGPFTERPAYERALAVGLARFALITPRERTTAAYLRDDLGLDAIQPMPDPAFALAPEPLEPSPLAESLHSHGAFIGVNLSPLLARRAGEGAFARAAGTLLRRLLARADTRVLLIPHVEHPPATGKTGDYAFLRQLIADLDLVPSAAERLHLVSPDLRAGQYKHIVGYCRCLVSARTHLAIAGYAQGVPTVALGYSRKAGALDHDVYGDAGHHLPAERFSAATVERAVDSALEARDDLTARAARYLRDGEADAAAARRKLAAVAAGGAP